MGLLILLGTGISVVRVWLQGRVVRLKENLWHLGRRDGKVHRAQVSSSGEKMGWIFF